MAGGSTKLRNGFNRGVDLVEGIQEFLALADEDAQLLRLSGALSSPSWRTVEGNGFIICTIVVTNS